MKKKIVLVSLVILGMIFLGLIGCGGKSSSDVEKMLGKWTIDNDFVVEIKRENDSYTLIRGDKYDPASLTVKNGQYDKENKRLIFVEENKPSRKPHEFWYDSEKDELIATHQDGTTDSYKRVKE